MSALSRRRLSAVLLHQNECLRESILREFAPLAKNAREMPTYSASMAAYKSELLSAVDANGATLQRIFGPPEAGMLSNFKLTLGIGSTGDAYDGLGSIWRHLAKDWSAQGSGQQATMRERVVTLTRNECMTRQHGSERLRVLVPGCGQGRLAYTIASALCSSGVEVTGLERSEATLALARHFIEDDGGVNGEPYTFHPFLDAFTNNWDVASRCAVLTVPDVPASERQRVRSSGSLILKPDDFLTSRDRGKRQYDVVVTSFLLDCLSEGIEEGVRAVGDALPPGGLWIFAGPLHYFQGGSYVPRPSPTLEQVLSLAVDFGMEIELPPESISAPYVSRPGAFLPEASWTVPLFTARKKRTE